jgi:hypothetical protein
MTTPVLEFALTAPCDPGDATIVRVATQLKTPGEVRKALGAALARWVNETPDGAKVWADTVGDIPLCVLPALLDNPNIQQRLRDEGIESLAVEEFDTSTLGWDASDNLVSPQDVTV